MLPAGEKGDSGTEFQDAIDPLLTSSTIPPTDFNASSSVAEREGFGVKASRGQGATKPFNASLNSPQKLNQPSQTETKHLAPSLFSLCLQSDGQSEISGDEVVSEQTDKRFNNLVEAWLKDSSCDESYREILVSFDTMFRLVTHNNVSPVSHTIIDEMDDLSASSMSLMMRGPLKEPKTSTVNATLKESYSQTEKKGNVFLNQALLLATEEKISWRAFYTNQKSVPKAHFFESLGFNTETLTNTSAPTCLNPLQGQGWTNNREATLEKKFFYQTSKKDG